MLTLTIRGRGIRPEWRCVRRRSLPVAQKRESDTLHALNETKCGPRNVNFSLPFVDQVTVGFVTSPSLFPGQVTKCKSFEGFLQVIHIWRWFVIIYIPNICVFVVKFGRVSRREFVRQSLRRRYWSRKFPVCQISRIFLFHGLIFVYFFPIIRNHNISIDPRLIGSWKTMHPSHPTSPPLPGGASGNV